MKTNAKTTGAAALDSFPGAKLADTYKREDAFVSKMYAARRALMDAWLDSLRAAGLTRDKEGCEAVKRAVRENQAVIDANAVGSLTDGTIRSCAISAERAFFHGIPWTSDLAQKPDFALPWANPNMGRPSKKPSDKGSDKGSDKASDKASDKGTSIGAPADAVEARKFIAGQLLTLVAYGNKHMKMLDLTTRDILPQLAKLSETLRKLDAAS